MRAFKAICLVVLLVTVLSACAPAAQPAAPAPAATQSGAAPQATQASQPAASGEALKIALIFPMTGDVSSFGISSKQGSQMAIDEWNAKGGVNGQKIETIVADSRCDAQEARNQAVKVTEVDKVKFIIGEVCSSASIPISEVANQKHVVQISPTSTNPKVTVDENGKHKPYTFRACFLDPFQGDVLASFAYKDLGKKTAAILYDQGNDYVSGLAGYIKDSFTKMGGTVAVYKAYVKEDTDFSASLSEVANAKADVLFLPDYYNKVSLIAKQAKEKKIDAVMIGGDGWDSDKLDKQTTDGGYFSDHYSSADPRPIVQNFLKTYTEKYGAAPDALAVLAYDAANFLLSAIKETGSADPEKVKDTMLKVKVEGISGEIVMNENGDPVKAAAITQVKDGKFNFVKFVKP